jgi:hypothetical protein
VPRNYRKDTNTGTQMGGIYGIAAQMGSGAMNYMKIFMNIDSYIQKLILGAFAKRGVNENHKRTPCVLAEIRTKYP